MTEDYILTHIFKEIEESSNNSTEESMSCNKLQVCSILNILTNTFIIVYAVLY